MNLAVNFWQIVKKANQTLLPVLLSLVLLTTAAAAKTIAHPANEAGNALPISQNSLEPSATFERIWVDYDITQGGVKGMRIHVKFKVYDMKSMSGYLAVYFQTKDGTPLEDSNGKFDSADGTVALYKEITPGYAVTAYDDYQVFMPYSELDLEDGNYSLRMDVDVIYKEGGLVDHLTFHDFTYDQGDKTSSKVSAEFGRVWVDYDITQGGQKGMRIHAKFTVVGMKGIPGYLAIYFQKKGGTKLYTSNRAYRSKEGQTAIYFEITPGYERTVYEDAQVFIPYNEFNLTKGKWDLQMDVDVIYENGDLIQHLTLHDFWYEKS
jgi:peptide methionine sulfoxide reductase MsrB